MCNAARFIGLIFKCLRLWLLRKKTDRHAFSNVMTAQISKKHMQSYFFIATPAQSFASASPKRSSATILLVHRCKPKQPTPTSALNRVGNQRKAHRTKEQIVCRCKTFLYKIANYPSKVAYLRHAFIYSSIIINDSLRSKVGVIEGCVSLAYHFGYFSVVWICVIIGTGECYSNNLCYAYTKIVCLFTDHEI